jgi:hypothetical protein
VGDYLTATVTDQQGNSSEFALNLPVADAPGATPTPTATPPGTGEPTPTPPAMPTPAAGQVVPRVYLPLVAR